MVSYVVNATSYNRNLKMSLKNTRSGMCRNSPSWGNLMRKSPRRVTTSEKLKTGCGQSSARGNEAPLWSLYAMCSFKKFSISCFLPNVWGSRGLYALFRMTHSHTVSFLATIHPQFQAMGTASWVLICGKSELLWLRQDPVGYKNTLLSEGWLWANRS